MKQTIAKKSITNALLEVGLEEVPARFMLGILEDLKLKAEKELQASRIKYRSIRTLGTPRRLVLYIEGIAQKQEDVTKEVRGPSKDAAFANGGTPTKAAEGFANSQGVTVKDLKIKKMGEREFVVAQVTEKGIESSKVLETAFPKIIKSLYMPISMRWGEGDEKFIRPVHWVFAACGSKTLNISISGIKASNMTHGHRYLSPKPLIVNITKGIDIDPFKKILLKGHVILDQADRRKRISDQVSAAAKKLGGEPIMDKELLEEVNFLVECPEAVVGSFKKEYLNLPKDVLVTSMKKNQKYFSVADSSDRLMPAFINITNGTAIPDMKNVREGNERVLTARLADAQFFFNEDRKKFLADLIPGLTKVAFYEKLGTVFEKVERVTALSEWIAKELKLTGSHKENIKEIAGLCKADLLTQMVYEFPELQGVMGREYAFLEGKAKEVANGLFDHYLPRFAGDILPASVEGTVVGIADKIDSIVGCFSINLIPTGSEDPFGLRRQAHGIVSVLLGRKQNLDLYHLIEKSYKLFETLFLGELFSSGKVKYNEAQKVIPEVLRFLAARLKAIMLENKIRYDVADAVLSVFSDVLDGDEKARAIQKHINEDWLKGVVFTADRLQRLAVNATRGNVIESDFAADEEKALYALYLEVNDSASEAIGKDDYASAMKAFSRMTQPVENFFDKVMVMDKDERLKANRLALLKTLENMFLEVADFPKIVM